MSSSTIPDLANNYDTNTPGLLIAAYNLYGSHAWVKIVASLALVVACIMWSGKKGITAPYTGSLSRIEPKFLVRVRYAIGAHRMLSYGYSKWKDEVFKLLRHDGDLVVLPRKYLDELQNVPLTSASAIKGLIKNFGGQYSGISTLTEKNLVTRGLQRLITPNLVKIFDDIQDELDYAFEKEMPSCEDWTTVSIHSIILKIVERVTHRVLNGPNISRNETWVEWSSKYAENVIGLQISIRFFPLFLRPLMNFIMPFSRGSNKWMKKCKALLVAEIENRRDLEKAGSSQENKPLDLLQFIIDSAVPGTEDYEPEHVGYQAMLATLVAGHSVAGTASHALVDLMYRPDLVEELRLEAIETIEAGGWSRSSLNKMWKMDSFMRESQRMNPLSLLGFHRIIEDPSGITLYDGTHLPYKSHVCTTPGSFSNDPSDILNPETFDPLRYYNMRMKSEEEARKHTLAMYDKNHMHFGYGTWSCPGRFLASDELKMMFTKLLLEYEIKSPEGGRRPPNWYLEEFVFIPPASMVTIRKRVGSTTG